MANAYEVVFTVTIVVDANDEKAAIRHAFDRAHPIGRGDTRDRRTDFVRVRLLGREAPGRPVGLGGL